jgi:competence protein ComEC
MTLIYLACAWLLGVYLSSLFYVPVQLLAVVSALCVAASITVCRHPRLQPRHSGALRLGSACLLVVSLGLWRYDLARPTLVPGALAAHNDRDKVSLRGLVVNDPLPRDRSANLQLSVRELKADATWIPMRGHVLVQVPSYEEYRYGDELEVQGALETPPVYESFSYRTYLARQGIHSLLRYPRITLLARDQGQPLSTFLYTLKRRTQGVISAILPEPQAALLTGILLGSDEAIPSSLMDQFRATGTAHIIAISGFNITIISAALVRVFSRLLQRYAALIVAVGAIALYTVLVGAEPPVVRAAIMGGLSALALIVGRQGHALTSLLAAAWLMTAWQPLTLWDVGFQLSFSASLGLILYAETLQKAAESLLERFVSMEAAAPVARLLNASLLSTLAALATTLPLMIYHFGDFSPLSLVSNLLILPLQPAIMYLGSTAAMAGLAYLPLGQVLGWAAWLFLTYTIRIVEITANWIHSSGASSSIHPALLLAYYGLLTLFTLNPTKRLISADALKRLLARGAVRKAVVSALVVVLVLVWLAVASLPDGRLHVAFLDVGQGDAILIETPAGHRLLVDGGPSPAALLAALGRYLPFWDRRIDMILLSHPHEDHLRGLLSVLQRYRVRQVIASDVSHDSALFQQWRQQLDDRSIPLLAVQHPLLVDFGDGPTTEVFSPHVGTFDSLDETSLVAHLTWEKAAFLFTGDLEAEDLLSFQDEGWSLACTVLKVPHHGSNAAVSEDLLMVTRPDLAVVSVGADNRFGHPAAETLACLEQAGIRALRTDQVGTVEVTTDGERYWVRTGGSRSP